MTQDELEQVQAACHEWLRQPGTAHESRLTIAAENAVSSEVHVEVRSILTFDNFLIRSAIDRDSGVCYTKLIGPSGEPGEFVDTPLEMIHPNPPAAERTDESSRYKKRLLAITSAHELPHDNTQQVIAQANELPSWWIEKQDSSTDDQPKYLLYTNQELLGYSFLERAVSNDERRGRFHPSDSYFDYAEIFGEMAEVENEVFEVSVQQAYGIDTDDDSKIRDKFNDLCARIEALKLFLTDEDSRRIEASEIKLEDRARYYDDESERWLHAKLG